MKSYILYFTFFCFTYSATAQYNISGQIKNQNGEPLSNVKIYVNSTKLTYTTSYSGAFNFRISAKTDSIKLHLASYDDKTIIVKADSFQVIVLKQISNIANADGYKLTSLTTNLNRNYILDNFIDNETYFKLIENKFINAQPYPNTAFSLNVNKASYSNVRRFLNMESEVPPDAVRIEEVINYFNLSIANNTPTTTFGVSSIVTQCPWNNSNQLLFVNINAKKLALDSIPPGNFVFLIDVSGSMDMPNRLPLLKKAFQIFVRNLRPIDKVSIVIYGGMVGVHMQPISGMYKDSIINSIESLQAYGDTPGEAAIRKAYKLARESFIKDGNNRVILATDGDFNVGEKSEEALEKLIINERRSGVYLTCLGVGMGNFKDSKLQTLAKNGNGNYAYLDDVQEAEKILMKELTQTLYAVAENVFVNVKFNENFVKQYRLLGFDNSRDSKMHHADKLEGGEIGSGSSVLAIFEILPVSTNSFQKNINDNIADIELGYTDCINKEAKKISHKAINNFTALDSLHSNIKFATALTMFGLLLKKSEYKGTSNWDAVINTAKSAINPNNYLQQEFLDIALKAKKIYSPKKGRKHKKSW